VLARVGASMTRRADVFRRNYVSASKGWGTVTKSADVFKRNDVSASKGWGFCDKNYYCIQEACCECLQRLGLL